MAPTGTSIDVARTPPPMPLSKTLFPRAGASVARQEMEEMFEAVENESLPMRITPLGIVRLVMLALVENEPS